MRPDRKRLDRIARLYGRLVGEGHAPTDDTYLLAVQRIDRAAKLKEER